VPDDVAPLPLPALPAGTVRVDPMRMRCALRNPFAATSAFTDVWNRLAMLVRLSPALTV
jgi:hypothetical protein